MRSVTAFLLSLALLVPIPVPAAQPSHDWQEATAQLHPGDHIRLSLKKGSIDGLFASSTPQDITIDATTTPKEAVFRIQRYLPGHSGGHRVRNAAIGAAIGFGVGFIIGIGVTHSGKCNSGFGPPCRALEAPVDLISGGGALVAGGIVGALIPQSHPKETLYSFK